MSIYQKDQLLHVKEALNSVINQTYLFCHIYIQIDGPVNNEIIEFLHSCTNSVFFVYERDKNRGLAVSLNELLNIVLTKEYEYIARMDADDIYEFTSGY